jgi:hypothetical protein
VLPEQHPLQFDGPHAGGAVQTPAVHVVPVAHVLHADPFAPHSTLSVPLKQLLPTQHPEQLLGPHVVLVTQTLFTQLAPVWHAMHVAPPKPHDASVPPATHLSFTQHPEQLDGPHFTGAWHVPPTPPVTGIQLDAVAAHDWHCPPFVPHAVASVPVRQVVPSQQPLQFVASHVGLATHRPPGVVGAHVWPSDLQSWHSAPA